MEISSDHDNISSLCSLLFNNFSAIDLTWQLVSACVTSVELTLRKKLEPCS